MGCWLLQYKTAGLNYVYMGNVPGHPLEHTDCPECGKVFVERLSFDITGWHMNEKNGGKHCGNEISHVDHSSKSINGDAPFP